MRRRAARRAAGVVVGAVVREGMGVAVGREGMVVVLVASGEEEEGRWEGLVGREGGVDVAEEEDMSVLGERERKGSVGVVVSVRCRFARREVKNAVWKGRTLV